MGSISSDDEGRQTASDNTGRILGRYDPATDVTHTPSGRPIGRGNFLAALISHAWNERN
ncbi:hypothetical protein LMG28140_02314 [Paraburkholderia metrosideri]|uniref:Uncharacterized protein n=1 Tax=Paraburkholderia metrosideri TaxID=580937 RepID=A0ABM8NKF0_9BURK|nr:hypothetical protein LMG28140_02314 [Paraburkholderia metrosideri]